MDFEIRLGDLLAADWGGPFAACVSNLPYRGSTQILRRLVALESRAVVLIQLELAQKLCAAPGTARYGPLAAVAQASFDVQPIPGAQTMRDVLAGEKGQQGNAAFSS